MSKQIPQDKTLSDADRLYLLQRGHTSQIAYLDQQYPPDPDALAAFEAKQRGDVGYTGDMAIVNGLRARVAQLEAYITEELGADVPPVPGEEPEEDAEELEGDYDTWSLADLQAECGTRQLSKSGTKAELAARLAEYDAAQ